ncbi:MAG: SGNH/GDSL hydrolase family protein [Candidatus Eremiobacteraeota bacterium]|nr:SGNH/GDSL hydrolase family protein [Candidatus Eremiobacteraeota bacterium]
MGDWFPKALGACAALVLATGCAAKTDGPVREAPPRRSIDVFGDSLALGTGASDASLGFTFLLFRSIEQREPTAQITDYAVGGARLADLESIEIPRARGEAPTDVWICGGANDVTRGTPAAKFPVQARRLLGSVRARWPRAALVVFGVPDVSRSPLFAGYARNGLHRAAQRDNAALQAAARSAGARFVDLFAFSQSVGITGRYLAADNFHPNDQGHAAIAAYAAKALGLR